MKILESLVIATVSAIIVHCGCKYNYMALVQIIAVIGMAQIFKDIIKIIVGNEELQALLELSNALEELKNTMEIIQKTTKNDKEDNE